MLADPTLSKPANPTQGVRFSDTTSVANPKAPRGNAAPDSAETVDKTEKLKKLFQSTPGHFKSLSDKVSLLRKLEHPGILRYIGSGAYDESNADSQISSMFVVVELMEGGALSHTVMKEMVNSGKALFTTQDSLKWCIQIAKALAYMHSTTPKVVHRDLKLENILLKGTVRGQQEVCIADLGLVALVGQPLPTASVIHTPISSLDRREALERTYNKSFFKLIMNSGHGVMADRCISVDMQSHADTEERSPGEAMPEALGEISRQSRASGIRLSKDITLSTTSHVQASPLQSGVTLPAIESNRSSAHEDVNPKMLHATSSFAKRAMSIQRFVPDWLRPRPLQMAKMKIANASLCNKL
eukprot:gene7817-1014_t